MVHLKRWGIFVLILALLSAGAALLFWDTGRECLSVLGTGRGSSSYLLASADTEGKVYVLGQDREGYFLVLGDQTGAHGERHQAPALPPDPAGDGGGAAAQ